MAEDGALNLIYSFSRTGPTVGELSVNYTVAGTATPGSDYSGIGSASGTRSIIFADGFATATLTIDPVADSTIEVDEFVALSLAPGVGYTISSSSAVVAAILNDEPYRAGAITIHGLNLGTTPIGYAFRSNGNTPTQISKLGAFVSAANLGGWTGLAIASSPANTYSLYLQNSNTGPYKRMTLDDRGELTGAESLLSQDQLHQGDKGDDLLIGSSDIDLFTYASGFGFDSSVSGVDAILNFNPAQDFIRLSHITFAALAAGTTLPEAQFARVSTDASAASSSALIVYNSSNGNLYYNPNGVDAGFAASPESGGLFAQMVSSTAGATPPFLTSKQFVLGA